MMGANSEAGCNIGGGGQRWKGVLVASGPYGLNDVQGIGLGKWADEVRRG